MEPNQFWSLLARKLAGEASLRDLYELEKLVFEHPELRFWQRLVRELWNNREDIEKEPGGEEKFLQLHNVSWEEKHSISENFLLTKQQQFFSEINTKNKFDLIYFDAFGIRVQPELWTEEIFEKMHDALKPNGVLVTYAANGNARRAMQAVGFIVERLPGPPGKKEMLRGTKL